MFKALILHLHQIKMRLITSNKFQSRNHERMTDVKGDLYDLIATIRDPERPGKLSQRIFDSYEQYNVQST